MMMMMMMMMMDMCILSDTTQCFFDVLTRGGRRRGQTEGLVVLNYVFKLVVPTFVLRNLPAAMLLHEFWSAS